jgi:hypothetical protein
MPVFTAKEPKDHASLVGLFSDEPELMDDGIEQGHGRKRNTTGGDVLAEAPLDRDLVFGRVVP